MKLVFHLKDDPEFIQAFDTPDEIIIWTYDYSGLLYYSRAFNELVDTNYYLN